MRRQLAFALCGVLLFACIGGSFCADEPEASESDVEDVEDAGEVEEERAFLILRKYIDEKEVIVGKNFTLKVDLYNAGSSAALDVKVTDTPLPPPLEIAGGSSTGTFDRIGAGRTVSFTYTVIATATPASPYLRLQPATAEYLPSEDIKTPQVVYSSAPWLLILSNLQKGLRSALHVGSYISGGTVTTLDGWKYVGIVGVILGLGLGGKVVTDSFAEARKKNQYKKALAEVEKMK